MIKHLVLAGGGPIGLVQWGVLKKLTEKNIICYDNIETIYATSFGCFIALIYSLNFEMSWIDDFFVKRPWKNIVNFTSLDYLNLMQTKGLIDEDFLIKCVKPIFLAKNIDVNITLEEFYKLTKKNIHFFTANLNNFCKEDINYITHPKLKLITAINMSITIPILVKPVYYKNSFYLDGGFFVNNPINDCIYDNKCNSDEILALVNYKNVNIKNKLNSNENKEIKEDINLFNFLIFIIKSLFNKLFLIEKQNTIVIKNTINCSCTNKTVDIDYWIYVFNTENERLKLIIYGNELAENFINSNVIIDNSNVIIDNSNIIIDNSNIIIDNTNIIIDNSNIIIDNSNISIK
jgi:predicted acylesterase/phospholipase RssA